MNARLESGEIRVFVSSTFTDMVEEREYLARHIFPEFRAECASRGVEFVDIDLRWGITEEQANRGETIAICLSEIDRCREHPPCFIGLVGEKYGWVPGPDEIAKAKNTIVGGGKQLLNGSQSCSRSVTDLEFQYGVFNCDSEGMFFIRSEDLTESLFFKSNGGLDEYYTKDEASKKKLRSLKQQIRKSERLILGGYKSIEELGRAVKLQLYAYLNKHYPIGSMDSTENTKDIQYKFIQQRLKHYINRPRYTSQVINSIQQLFNNSLGGAIQVVGGSGIGKSSFLASIANDLQRQHITIPYFIGAEAADINRWQSFVLSSLSRCSGGRVESVVFNGGWGDFLVQLESHRPPEKRPVILVLDAVDQLPNAFDIVGNISTAKLPENICLIFSARSEIPYSDQIFNIIKLDSLKKTEVLKIVKEYGANHTKSFSRNQVVKILNSQAVRKPIFLIVLLEMLRVWSTHHDVDFELDALLCKYNAKELFKYFIGNKLSKEYSTEDGVDVATVVLGFIALSRNGLSENDISFLVNRYIAKVLPSNGPRPLFTRMRLSVVLAILRPYLSRERGKEKLMHSALEIAVLDIVDVKFLREVMIEYYSTLGNDSCSERLYQRIRLARSKSDEIDTLWEVIKEAADLKVFSNVYYSAGEVFDELAYIVDSLAWRLVPSRESLLTGVSDGEKNSLDYFGQIKEGGGDPENSYFQCCYLSSSPFYLPWDSEINSQHGGPTDLFKRIAWKLGSLIRGWNKQVILFDVRMPELSERLLSLGFYRMAKLFWECTPELSRDNHYYHIGSKIAFMYGESDILSEFSRRVIGAEKDTCKCKEMAAIVAAYSHNIMIGSVNDELFQSACNDLEYCERVGRFSHKECSTSCFENADSLAGVFMPLLGVLMDAKNRRFDISRVIESYNRIGLYSPVYFEITYILALCLEIHGEYIEGEKIIRNALDNFYCLQENNRYIRLALTKVLAAVQGNTKHKKSNYAYLFDSYFPSFDNEIHRPTRAEAALACNLLSSAAQQNVADYAESCACDRPNENHLRMAYAYYRRAHFAWACLGRYSAWMIERILPSSFFDIRIFYSDEEFKRAFSLAKDSFDNRDSSLADYKNLYNEDVVQCKSKVLAPLEYDREHGGRYWSCVPVWLDEYFDVCLELDERDSDKELSYTIGLMTRVSKLYCLLESRQHGPDSVDALMSKINFLIYSRSSEDRFNISLMRSFL